MGAKHPVGVKVKELSINKKTSKKSGGFLLRTNCARIGAKSRYAI
jgi:hypothetical protein